MALNLPMIWAVKPNHLGASGFHRLALTAHEHALVEQSSEYSQGSRFVKPTFVATDRRHVGRVLEGGSAFFGLVAQPIFGDFGLLFFAHG